MSAPVFQWNVSKVLVIVAGGMFWTFLVLGAAGWL